MRYKVLERIGKGGMGVVYRALHVGLNKPVAIKFLPANLRIGDKEALERFLREIRACTDLNHPNIIRIYDTGEMNGQPYYVMEMVEGRTFKTLLMEEGPRPAIQVLEILVQILDALQFCHERGMVHRDIKPHNLMIDDSSRVTLMDFGLVKSVNRTIITLSGKIVGSPHYVSPELIEGHAAGPRSDLFSLGAVAYELLTGQRAFPGSSLKEIGNAILYSQPPSIREVQRIDAALENYVMTGLLAKSPEARYGSAAEALTDAERILAGRSTVTRTRPEPRNSEKRRTRNHGDDSRDEGRPRRLVRETRPAPVLYLLVAFFTSFALTALILHLFARSN